MEELKHFLMEKFRDEGARVTSGNIAPDFVALCLGQNTQICTALSAWHGVLLSAVDKRPTCLYKNFSLPIHFRDNKSTKCSFGRLETIDIHIYGNVFIGWALHFTEKLSPFSIFFLTHITLLCSPEVQRQFTINQLVTPCMTPALQTVFRLPLWKLFLTPGGHCRLHIGKLGNLSYAPWCYHTKGRAKALGCYLAARHKYLSSDQTLISFNSLPPVTEIRSNPSRRHCANCF